MANSPVRPRRNWRGLVVFGLTLAALYWLRQRTRNGSLRRRYLQAVEWFNLRVHWWTLPGFFALLNFGGMRALLRARNLHDTQALPQSTPTGSGRPTCAG